MPTKAELSRRSKNAEILYSAACTAEMLGEKKLSNQLRKLADDVRDGSRVPVSHA
jgi:hypothetical protein